MLLDSQSLGEQDEVLLEPLSKQPPPDEAQANALADPDREEPPDQALNLAGGSLLNVQVLPSPEALDGPERAQNMELSYRLQVRFLRVLSGQMLQIRLLDVLELRIIRIVVK